MKHEITLCRVPRLLPEGRKGSLALWEGCTRWFRAVLWGPHPALRATFPSGARLFCASVLLTCPLGQGSWSKGIAHPANRNADGFGRLLRSEHGLHHVPHQESADESIADSSFEKRPVCFVFFAVHFFSSTHIYYHRSCPLSGLYNKTFLCYNRRGNKNPYNFT